MTWLARLALGLFVTTTVAVVLTSESVSRPPVEPGFWAGPLEPATDSAALEDDRAALQQAAALVKQAQSASGSTRAQLVADALVQLDSQPDLANNTWLRTPLDRVPPDLTTAEARLQSAIDALGAPAAPSDASGARQQLTNVLADPRFHPRTWLDYVPAFLVPLALALAAVVRFVSSVISWPFDRLAELLLKVLSSRWFGRAALVGAVAIAGGLVWLYRRGLGSALVRQAEVARPAAELPTTSPEALRAARDHAFAGRYRDACHYVLLSTMLWIEERGVTRFDRAATNREHLDRLSAAASSPDLARALGPLVARFDRVWYGQATVSNADYEDLLALADRLWRVGT